MKSGSKYYPLHQHLVQCGHPSVTLTLSEIETTVGSELPDSARTKRSWWSNRNKGALQAQAWIEAGYHTDTVDLENQTITFQKFDAEYRVNWVNGEITWDQTAIRALRKHMKLTQAQFAETLGVRRQTVSEWENGVYLPDRSTSKHLELVAEKEDFNPLPEDEAAPVSTASDG